MTTNKIALITGGSRGLGKNMALSIAKKGIDVILTYNSKKEEAEAVVKEIKAEGQKAVALQLNTANIKSFGIFIETLSTTLKETFTTDHFDFLINNAGIGIHAAFAETTEEQF